MGQSLIGLGAEAPVGYIVREAPLMVTSTFLTCGLLDAPDEAKYSAAEKTRA